MFGPFTVPVVATVLLFPFVALLVFIPFVFRSYRKYGRLGLFHLLVFYSFVLYAIALLFFVILPLPEITANFCAVHNLSPQLQPFDFVATMLRELPHLSIRSVVSSGVFLHAFFNVLFFVPLGFCLRYYFRLGLLGALALSFGVTLALELTQLSGLWGIYPCPYRLFDVDDLLMNTLGAFIGFLIPPLLGFLPRPVVSVQGPIDRIRLTRRAIAFAIDLAFVGLLSLGVYVGVFGLIYLIYGYSLNQVYNGPVASIILLIFGFLDFALLPLASGGYTIGKFVVGIRIAGPTMSRPGAGRLLVRYLALVFPLTLLGVLGELLDMRGLRDLALLALAGQATVLAINVLAMLANRERRSLGSLISRTRNVVAIEV